MGRGAVGAEYAGECAANRRQICTPRHARKHRRARRPQNRRWPLGWYHHTTPRRKSIQARFCAPCAARIWRNNSGSRPHLGTFCAFCALRSSMCEKIDPLKRPRIDDRPSGGTTTPPRGQKSIPGPIPRAHGAHGRLRPPRRATEAPDGRATPRECRGTSLKPGPNDVVRQRLSGGPVPKRACRMHGLQVEAAPRKGARKGGSNVVNTASLRRGLRRCPFRKHCLVQKRIKTISCSPRG